MEKQEPLRLIQAQFTRKRFVLGERFSFNEVELMFQTYNNDLKIILDKTTFNVVSDSSDLVMSFFVYPQSTTWQTAFDVVGVPQPDSHFKDFNQLKVLKYQSNLKPWLSTFDEIHQIALKILKSLAPKSDLSEPFYQIVISGNNLELHFFR